jgi:ribosomal protein S18 acetylase RimI-like enzyme
MLVGSAATLTRQPGLVVSEAVTTQVPSVPSVSPIVEEVVTSKEPEFEDRSYERDDYNELAELHKECLKLKSAYHKRFYENLEQPNENSLSILRWMIERDETGKETTRKLVAFVTLSLKFDHISRDCVSVPKRVAYVSTLGVKEGYQRRGFGSALLKLMMQKVRDHVVQKNIAIAGITLHVRKDNHLAQKVYVTQGFKHLYTVKHYYHTEKMDGLYMMNGTLELTKSWWSRLWAKGSCGIGHGEDESSMFICMPLDPEQ